MSGGEESGYEDFQERARQVLDWHRAGYRPVAEQIRANLPTFEERSDREILAAPFSLADARMLIARQAGYDDWASLQSAAEAESHPPLDPPADGRLMAVTPCLLATDLAASAGYFQEALGFDVAFMYGDPPFYSEVVRDGVRIALRHVDSAEAGTLGLAAESRAHRRDAELLAATIAVDAAEPLFQEFQGRGAVFVQTLRAEPWGSRSFIVEDPQGNLIAFADAGAAEPR